jgi:hypothetical protein
MRSATFTRTLALMLGAACFAVAGLPPSARADFAGGKSAKADCYIVYKGITVTSGQNKVECTDGDPTCDTDGEAQGTCSFGFEACFNDPNVPSCTPSNVTAVVVNGATINTPTLPTSENVCGDQSVVAVPLKQGKKGPKKGKLKLKVTAESVSKPKKDKDVIALICNPSAGGGTGPTSCPPNGDVTLGNPNTITTKMLPEGSDLDNGWTGTSFNFPVIQDLVVTACISNCDKTTDPTCDVKGPGGAGSPNGVTLGPPLPLVAGGVPVCVVNNFATTGAEAFTGTVNLQTGDSTLDIKLLSDVYITDRTKVCPRCEAAIGATSTCQGGPNNGRPCTAHGKTRVEETFAANKIFTLSRDCPPDRDSFLAQLNISLAPTTGEVGTPGTGGSKPCRENEQKGVSVQDDNCVEAGDRCSANPGNCTGLACVSQVTDPSNPPATICVDTFGGLSQNCCNITKDVPCHPTYPAQGATPAGPGIVRKGRAVATASPSPWGDDQYPKTASGAVLVSTFCEPPTGTSTVDLTTGLPGPGALVFNTDATVSFVPPPAP